MTLLEKIAARSNRLGLYGLSPPRQETAVPRLRELAEQQRERIASLGADGLVIYDLQDEADRNAEPRPFPFLPTVDPSAWAAALAPLAATPIVYKAVPASTPEALTEWLLARGRGPVVLVGAPSARTGALKLSDAYALARATAPDLLLGGVAIPERHQRSFEEHLRMLTKVDAGCRFFVTQAVYDVHSSLSVLSDYALEIGRRGQQPVPIVFTFAPCGSAKTLEFMKWLGISFPRWLENELRGSADIVERSVRLCERNFRELRQFAREKGLPIGFNVESVSIRKVEIDAATALFTSLRAISDES